jgi:MoaA/NifB/PqqE/SkfB family radical SAM enzyme
MKQTLLANAKNVLRPAYYWLIMLTGAYRRLVREVTIEASSACNCRCIMCAVPQLKREKGLMKFDDFRAIVDKLPSSIRQVDFAFAGEPLLNPDIFKMVRYFRGISQSARIRISTNGMRLRYFSPEEVLRSGVSEIDVALDGATAATHESYRQGSSFEEICESLKNLCATKKRLGLASRQSCR